MPKKQAPEEETPETEEETKEETEEGTEETAEEETEEKETEEETEEVAEKAAKKISAYLGLDDIKKKIEEMDKKIDENSNLKSKLYGLNDVSKESIDKLSKEEKIVAFFGALLRNDHVELKALSEGVAADGGYEMGLMPT